VAGDFIDDLKPGTPPFRTIDAVPLTEQPAMLDKAALHFCLADAFHPGCEMTWPLRHPNMFEKPFRCRLRPAGQPEPDYGSQLTPAIALQPGGSLSGQIPGSISRGMALPWQSDTAFCRSGYPPSFDQYVPSFWPARVSNQVLTEEDYEIVVDTSQPRDVRLAAFNRRAFWTRGLPRDVVAAMMEMVEDFAAMGGVEPRLGIQFDPDFPPVIYVEAIPTKRVEALRAVAATMRPARPPEPLTQAQLAGWEDEAHPDAFSRVRVRFRG
jgi:L-lysine epsilon oxidase C-terminal domain